MPMRGSRPYLIRRRRRNALILICGLLFVAAAIAIGLVVAVQGKYRFCRVVPSSCAAPGTASVKTSS
jgi:hypothetical protein